MFRKVFSLVAAFALSLTGVSVAAAPAQAVTSTPLVTITPLNNLSCQFRLVAFFPNSTDAGSARLTITDANSNAAVATLRDFAASTMFDVTLSATNMSALKTNADVVATTDASDLLTKDYCQKQLTATVSYQNSGAPVATASVIFIAQKVSTQPAYSWSALNDDKCTVRLTISFPSVGDAVKPRIYFGQSSYGYNVYLKTPAEGKLLTYEFPLDDEDAMSAATGVDSATPWGGIEGCGAESWWAGINYIDDLGAEVGSQVLLYPSVPVTPAAPCELGSYSATGRVPCTFAEPGYFVDTTGATSQTPCALGFYAPNVASYFCIPAPKGSYASSTGASSATACPAGQTTYLTGARSHFECYKMQVQTAKAVKVPLKSKFKTKIITPMVTDGGAALTLVASGPCSVSTTKITVVTKGVKTKATRYLITLGSKAGTCTLTYTNAGDDMRYPITSVKKIKVVK